jgi:hypothetical protein
MGGAPVAGWAASGGAQHGFEARGDEVIAAGAAVVLGGAPLARDEAVLLQALQRGVAGPLVVPIGVYSKVGRSPLGVKRNDLTKRHGGTEMKSSLCLRVSL